jgi:hypothetical protein
MLGGSPMLVIVSDLHLGDNAFSGTIPATAFRVFRERLRDMAYDASWRRGGRYRPIEELDLVLLGDILDFIRSELWPCVSPGDPEYVRPWSDPGGPALQSKLGQIADSILAENAQSLEVLRSFSDSREVMTLPPPTAGGGVAKVSRDFASPDRVPLKVRTHYVAGNHDWFLHLPGEAYNAIRRRVVSAMCLSNPANAPFPHDPLESEALLRLCERHSAWMRHGDRFDPLNCEASRDGSSLGDAIVVDLLNRFAATVRAELGHTLPAECVQGLRQIDYVRPLLLVPVWVNGLLARTCPDEKTRKRVKSIWNRLVREFLKLPFVEQRSETLPPGTLEKMALVLRISEGVSLGRLSRFMRWLSRHTDGGDGRPSFRDALTEGAIPPARSIVYGHTHRHEIVPLDVGGNGAFEQRYLNSGTWRVVHEQARRRPEAEMFTNHWVMSYLALYKDDERGGRPFEAWSGALALPG